MRAFTLALDRHCDVINNNNSSNKLSIKSFEVLSETLDSLTKIQHLLFNKIQTLENKINDILNTLKTKDQQIRLSTNELDKITTQLSKLDLGKTRARFLQNSFWQNLENEDNTIHRNLTNSLRTQSC